MDTVTYRNNLEKEKAELLHLLEHKEIHGRAQIVSHIRSIIDELKQLDNGTNWTQAHGDTAARITAVEIASQRKVMR